MSRRSNRFHPWCRASVVAALLFAASMASAQVLAPLGREPEPPPPEEEVVPPADEGFLDRYMRFWEHELEKVVRLDPYGVTSQLPKGYFSIKWQWDLIKAGRRYDSRRHLGPAMQPIEFELPTGETAKVDLDLSGRGGGHTFQFSYGITDPLDWYFEVPFMYMNVAFDPSAEVLDGEGNPVPLSATTAAMLGGRAGRLYTADDFICRTLPSLGRPSPGLRFKGQWLLGDINTGFSWNIFRTPRFSGALTARVFLPTGHRPHPNRNLTYGTGPELEVGIGGWAVGFTQGYDLRLFKHSWMVDIILSTEFTASYAFTQKRKYPTNFPTPGPAAALDAASFPDLSHLREGGTFSYTPGFGIDWTVQLGASLFGISFVAGFGVTHSQKPEIVGDANFIQMVDSLELLGSQTMWAIQLGASVTLVPLYLPIEIGFSWRKVVDGTDAIIFDDWWQIVVKAVIPLFPE